MSRYDYPQTEHGHCNGWPHDHRGARYSDMSDTMLFAWMGDDVEAILLVFAVVVAFVSIVVVLDLKLRGL
jgi:hypothetical protein